MGSKLSREPPPSPAGAGSLLWQRLRAGPDLQLSQGARRHEALRCRKAQAALPPPQFGQPPWGEGCVGSTAILIPATLAAGIPYPRRAVDCRRAAGAFKEGHLARDRRPGCAHGGDRGLQGIRLQI
eukprot:scaffold17261_cov106-Isochrysis_galbana.AAC.3